MYNMLKLIDFLIGLNTLGLVPDYSMNPIHNRPMHNFTMQAASALCGPRSGRSLGHTWLQQPATPHR